MEKNPIASWNYTDLRPPAACLEQKRLLLNKPLLQLLGIRTTLTVTGVILVPRLPIANSTAVSRFP